MYAIEARLHEEEELRIKEFNFLRDLVKKLIYSLEQKDIEHLDNKSNVVTAAAAVKNTITTTHTN